MIKNIFKTLLIFTFAFFTANTAHADFSFNEMELRFVQVSDVHLSDAPDTNFKVLSHSKELLNSAISDINRLKGLDFVVFTGDMVNEPTRNLYRDFFISLSKLNYPALFVLGNHDSAPAQDNNSGYLNKQNIIDIITNSNPYQPYGKAYFAFSPSENYRVIVLDTSYGQEQQSNGFLPDEQLIFLDNEISQNQDKVIVIFQHVPLFEPYKSADHRLLNANAYLDILKKYQKTPIAIFSGHYHATKIIRKGNVIQVSSPALVTYPNAYRNIIITNYEDRVDFVFKYRETKLEEVQRISKENLMAPDLYLGTPNDRKTSITVRKGYVQKVKLTKEEKRAMKLEEKTRREEIKAQKKLEKQAKKGAKNKPDETYKDNSSDIQD